MHILGTRGRWVNTMAADGLVMQGARATAAMVLTQFSQTIPVSTPVASFTKEVNQRLAKRPLKTNGRLANRGLTSLVKEATGGLTWSYLMEVAPHSPLQNCWSQADAWGPILGTSWTLGVPECWVVWCRGMDSCKGSHPEKMTIRKSKDSLYGKWKYSETCL